MKFQPGQSGNPAGRPRGSRNRRTIASERLLDDAAETLTKTAIELAAQGHPVALRLCMERICPTKDRPVAFELPGMATAADAVAAMGSIVEGIADGDLTPVQLAAVIQAFARTLSTAELERELSELVKAPAQKSEKPLHCRSPVFAGASKSHSAHVPAKWTPDRRHAHASIDESSWKPASRVARSAPCPSASAS